MAKKRAKKIKFGLRVVYRSTLTGWTTFRCRTCHYAFSVEEWKLYKARPNRKTLICPYCNEPGVLPSSPNPITGFDPKQKPKKESK